MFHIDLGGHKSFRGTALNRVLEMALQFAFIVHRGMGCDDESATDEEQAEKILFYYPRLTTVGDQLSKINMVEGLIDFAAKFSVDSISTVVMQQYTWAFLECEPGVWFVVAMDSQVHPYDHANDSGLVQGTHQPNTHAMEASLRNMYEMYCTTNGSIRSALESDITNTSADLIARVKALRKQIRKIQLRQRQEQQDLQNLQNREQATRSAMLERMAGDSTTDADAVVTIIDQVEHMGIRSDLKTVAEVQAEVDASDHEVLALTVQLSIALADPSYSPHKVRATLECFMLWYLNLGQLEVHTALQDMCGVRLLQPNYPDPVLHAINTYAGLTVGGASTGGSGAATSVNANVSSLSNGTLASSAGLGISPAAAVAIQSAAGGHSGVGVAPSVVGSLQSGLQATAGSGAISTAVLRIRHAVEQATLHQSIGECNLKLSLCAEHY
jgi:hypothetical protein